MFEPSIMPVPDRSSFPRAPAIHDHHGGIRKSGITVRAYRMCEVMIDVPHTRFYISKLTGEAFRAALLMPHAQEMQSGIQNVQIIQGHLSGGITFQVVAIRGSGMRPAEAHLVQLAGPYARKVEARTNRVTREARVVFDPTDTFFRDGK